ncbi:hypothetical protein AURDEDRAFT_166345 [Auricularia subglabra TFB-10046 SS5]|uniref:Uncharacterized protein n=1 Tax=Auricularia subglabra (strain TFB-10046 / SS5) TaxID=717982 RepID=J0WXN9_AURST|nr:hypothetical protein AURDEDRAFT_166345 [Auricularia subglabra TFB-10046 SS5]
MSFSIPTYPGLFEGAPLPWLDAEGVDQNTYYLQLEGDQNPPYIDPEVFAMLQDLPAHQHSHAQDAVNQPPPIATPPEVASASSTPNAAIDTPEMDLQPFTPDAALFPNPQAQVHPVPPPGQAVANPPPPAVVYALLYHGMSDRDCADSLCCDVAFPVNKDGRCICPVAGCATTFTSKGSAVRHLWSPT